MSYANYDDVLGQLRDAGLIVEAIETGRVIRTKVEGERERRGWYALHELQLRSGDWVMVGSFGVWHGDDNNAQKIDLKRTEISAEQRQALRDRMKQDQQRENARRAREAERSAARARAAWAKMAPSWTPAGGEPIATNAYLLKKGVAAHGARFSKVGNLVIPMCDETGAIHGLQVIYADLETKRRKGRDKDYWPAGLTKQGRFFLIGAPQWAILVAEGFATAASLHEATGYPVAVAFDAGNLQPVAKALRKRYRSARILVCADDDFLAKCPKQDCGALDYVSAGKCPACGTAYTHGNTGVERAQAAALAVGGAWIAPTFAADRGKKKITDFNDLASIEGPHSVSVQVEAAITREGWVAVAPSSVQGVGGNTARLKPITNVQELFDRFAVIYGHNKSLFDFQERMLLAAADVQMACAGRDTWKAWAESPDKRVVRISEVGFDPSEADPRITCNLWGGWPIEAKEGKCDELLALLEYLCLNEKNASGIFEWLLKWLAYPLKNPGAKMKTALVVHGPQRVGKNFFFESVMEIYGAYGEVIDQDALEDKYNDCFSKKLFLIADEVIARQELYHVKNKLKGMITGRRIRINPKNVKSYWEDNHCNLVFLSNETQPLVLERDDGRHVVLWTPPKLGHDFYKRVEREVGDGGIPALYWHLLNKVDLAGFNEYTPPPMTAAKQDLMDLSMDSTERFCREWIGGRIDHFEEPAPAKSTQIYVLYREWCGRMGYPRYAPEPKFLAELGKRSGAKKRQAHYLNGAGQKVAAFVFQPGAQEPQDRSQQIWLGECVEAFEQRLQKWRES